MPFQSESFSVQLSSCVRCSCPNSTVKHSLEQSNAYLKSRPINEADILNQVRGPKNVCVCVCVVWCGVCVCVVWCGVV